MQLRLAAFFLPLALSAQVTLTNGAYLTNGAWIGRVQPSNTQVNCNAASTQCVIIPSVLTADPYDTNGGFSGYADPSERTDPQTGTIFRTYSYLYTTAVYPCPAFSDNKNTHLLKSTDNGATWQYVGVINTGACVADPVTPTQNDLIQYEVANIVPYVSGGVTYWMMFVQVYSQTGTGATRVTGSTRWYFAGCPGTASTGPQCLSSTTLTEYLGTAATDGAVGSGHWSYQQNLTTINPAVNTCTSFFEPSLTASGSYVLATIQCGLSGGALPFYVQFSTPNPSSNTNWTASPPVWSYVGQFSTYGDAAGICGLFGQPGKCSSYTPYITQGDVVPCANAASGYCFVATEAVTIAGQKTSLGCFAAELNTLSPPTYVYTGGVLKVDALAVSSDSTPDGGGSCTYDLQNTLGMTFTHLEKSAAPAQPLCTAQGTFCSILMSTGLTF